MRLKDKVAIITGSSRGIGKEVALKFAKQGAKIVINYPFSGEKDNAQSVVEEIEALDGTATAIEADVTDMEQVKEMVKETKEEFGSIDILVNNAGITKDGLLLRMKESDWDAVLEVNLKGAFNATKAVTRTMMKQRSGRIINI